MGISPKHTMNRKRPVAQRIFTDRVEPRALFEKTLKSFTSDENYLVINYYGVGGIGKTRLVNELKESYISTTENWNACILNMNNQSNHRPSSALIELRKQLLKIYKDIKLTSFDLAYSIFWQKQNPGIELNTSNLDKLENSDLLTEVATEVFSTLEVVPGLNIASKVALLGKKGSKYFKDWWTKRGSIEFENLDNFSPPEIEERLSMFLTYDLVEYLSKSKCKRLCIFIDTYESIWEVDSKEGTFFSKDEWVRELVAQLKGVLFVVSGREKLRWAEVEPEWEQIIDSHIINSLSDNDSQYFLKSCSIVDPIIVESIIAASSGIPFFLDLAVDNYMKQVDSGKKVSAALFEGKTPREVLDRFIKYLNENESTTLKVLSVCRQYDRKLFEKLISRFKTGYPAINFSKLNSYSFIESLDDNNFSINPLMRKSLRESLDDELLIEIISVVINHYLDQIKDITKEGMKGYRNFDEAKFYYLTEKLKNCDVIKFLSQSGKINQYQCKMIEALANYEELTKHSTDSITIENTKIEIATTLRQNGQVKQALMLLENIINTCTENVYTSLAGKAKFQLGLCYYTLNSKNKDIEVSNKIYKLYIESAKIAENENDIQQLLYVNTGISTVMEDISLINDSIDLLKKSMIMAKENNLDHIYVDCLNGLARKYLLTKKYKEAIAHSEEGLKIWKHTNFYRGQLVMYSHILTALYFLKNKNYAEKAIKEAEKIKPNVTEKLILDMYETSKQYWS